MSLLLHGGASIILRSVNEEQNTGRAVITFLAGKFKPLNKKSPTNFTINYLERQTTGGVNETLGGPQVVRALRLKLRQDSSLLDLPVARVDTVVCQNNCSNHGACDEATRQCLCEAFWMQDLFAQYAGDGESNCGTLIDLFGLETLTYKRAVCFRLEYPLRSSSCNCNSPKPNWSCLGCVLCSGTIP